MGSLKNGAIRARILVWGPPGSGKTTTLNFVNGKLKREQKGEIEKVSLKAPNAAYELLPVNLGEVKGVPTQLDFQTAPGPWEHAPTRKKLLKGVDGVLFVANSIGSAMKENQKSLSELDEALKSMGRSLVTVPVVFQWMNQRAIGSIPSDEMQAKLNKVGAQTFAVLSDEQSAILKSFAAISKMAVKVVRDDYDAGKLSESDGAEELLGGEAEEEGGENPFTDLAGELAADMSDDFGKSEPAPVRDTPPPEGGEIGDELDALLSSQPNLKKPAGKMNGARFRLVGAGEPKLSPDGTLALPIRIATDQGEEMSLTISVKVVPEH